MLYIWKTKFPIEQIRLHLFSNEDSPSKASKNDLQRKLSIMSYEENPSGYTRIKIEELETDIEGAEAAQGDG